MSAPRTNIETQKRRHRGPLIGMAVVVLFALALIAYWLLDEASEARNPIGTDRQTTGQGVTIEGVETGTTPVPDAAQAPGAEAIPDRGGARPAPAPPPPAAGTD